MESNDVRSQSQQSRQKKSPAAKTKTIRQKEFIPAKPIEVYDALLNDTKHSAFTGAKATCERFVGGKFTAWDGYIIGKNIKLENGRRIVQEWMTSEWPKGYTPSILEMTLKPKGDGTEIHLVQTNVPAVQAANYKQGWTDYYWMPLKKYFSKKPS